MKLKSSRPAPDRALVKIAEYVCRDDIGDSSAYELARYCLMDALGCALQALSVPDCVKLLGPCVPDTVVPHGARVPGTQYQLDPVAAAFNISCLVRWLDFSDTWWAGGHPSDTIGGILATADHLSRARLAAGKKPMLMREVMAAMIKAYEIYGVLAEGNKFDRPEIGLDTSIMTKIASTPVITQMLGGTAGEIVNALSNAIVDGHPLTIYRKMPNAGPRKSWAAADTASRAVWLAWMTMRGEMGYPTALSANTWGFHDVLYHGRALNIPRPYACNVITNIQFKISYPAQRHAQTAAECAVRLHPEVKDRLDEIEKVVIQTHGMSLHMISVTGPLPTIAARDHCLQYIVAVGMLDGNITADSYEDEHAADPRIDRLRSEMIVKEEKRYTRDYSSRRHTNANAIQVFFTDGSKTPRIEVEYPIGDPSRRRDGIPLLEEKFAGNLARRYPPKQLAAVLALLRDQQRLEATSVNEFTDLLAI